MACRASWCGPTAAFSTRLESGFSPPSTKNHTWAAALSDFADWVYSKRVEGIWDKRAACEHQSGGTKANVTLM